jgi:hypothetical protein
MDQNPLPRGSLQVRDRIGQEHRVIPELPQAAVAVEAQYPAHPAGAVIVVDVFRIGRSADRAAAAPTRRQLVELHLTASQSGHHLKPSGTGSEELRFSATPRRRRLSAERSTARFLQ